MIVLDALAADAGLVVFRDEPGWVWVWMPECITTSLCGQRSPDFVWATCIEYRHQRFGYIAVHCRGGRFCPDPQFAVRHSVSRCRPSLRPHGQRQQVEWSGSDAIIRFGHEARPRCGRIAHLSQHVKKLFWFDSVARTFDDQE